MLKHRKELLQSLDLSSTYILDALFGEGALTERQYDEIKSKLTCYDQNLTLLEFLTRSSSGSDRDFVVFCNALKESYEWLSERLLRDAAEAGVNLSTNTVEDSAPPDLGDLPPPTEKDLMRISGVLSRSNWSAVMLELGVPYSDVEFCKSSKSSSPKLQCFQAFVIWLRKRGDDARFSDVYDAFVEAEVGSECLRKLRDVADKYNKAAASHS